MRKVSARKRILSLLSVVLILIPMLTLVAYASSAIYSFGHSYNGNGGTARFSGTKSDLGENSAATAGVTVSVAQFGAGSCTISMEDQRQVTITNAQQIYGTGTYTLWYDIVLPSSGTMPVYLACYAQNTVQAISGRFQP